MPNVLQQICEWVKGQPFWQQAALEKVLSGVPLTGRDPEELFQWLQEDAGFAPKTLKRPELFRVQRAGSVVRPRQGAVRLVELSNVRNVNALAPDQTLTFGPRVTLVFGNNGSGKSGYARLLAHAGRSRDGAELLPNVLDAAAARGPATADFTLSIDGQERTVAYAGKPCPELAEFYVFDAAAAEEHLTGSNPFFYSPGDLQYLAGLSKLVDQVRDRLDARVIELKLQPAVPVQFSPGSAVRQALDRCIAKPNIRELQQLATLSEAERRRIGELDVEIARLKAGDTTARRRELEQAASDLDRLVRQIDVLGDALEERALAGVAETLAFVKEAQAAALRSSAEQFNTDGYTRAGTPEWRDLVQAARRLTAPGFPHDGDSCPLCRQALGEQAQELLRRVWQYLDAAARQTASGAQESLDRSRRVFNSINTDLCGEQSVPRRRLQEYSRDVLPTVLAFAESAAACRAWALSTLGDPAVSSVPAPHLAPSPAAAVQAVVRRLRQDAAELAAADPSGAIVRLQAELDELRGREQLAAVLPAMDAYVKRCDEAAKLAKLRPSTTNITQLNNRLFEDLVTNRYVDLFKTELAALGRPLHVSANTRGQKGTTLKTLKVDFGGAAPKGATIGRVLSDGEKQAVALADFFTEVALDDDAAGILLDDPATALDEEWAAQLARKLVDESAQRQVVVFTHSLAFAREVERCCKNEGIAPRVHTMMRDPNGAVTGRVLLDSPFEEARAAL